jgi:hypothetical protein
MAIARIPCANEEITGCAGEDIKDCGYCTPCALDLLEAYARRIHNAEVELKKNQAAYDELAAKVLT